VRNSGTEQTNNGTTEPTRIARRPRAAHRTSPNHQPGSNHVHTTVNSYLADLGALVEADGVAAHHGLVSVVAGAARVVSPAAAAVLIDPDEPGVVRLRALAVASAALLRDPAAARSLRTALAGPVPATARPT
jgi:hypothetical protein